MNNLEGIPEGLEVVRWGTPTNEECVLGPGGQLWPYESNSQGLANLVVRTLPGYEIQYDANRMEWAATAVFAAPRILTVTFAAKDSQELARIEYTVRSLCGFQGLQTD